MTERLSSVRPRLMLVGEGNDGAILEIPSDPGLLVGRSDECDLSFDKAVISKRHARVYVHQGVVVLEDLGSTNGTFVNGRQIEGREVLDHGSVIGLGEPFLAPQHGSIVIQDVADRLLEEMRLFEFAPEHEEAAREVPEVDLLAELGIGPDHDGLEARREAGSLDGDPGIEGADMGLSRARPASSEDATVALELTPMRRSKNPWLLGLIILALGLAICAWFFTRPSLLRTWREARIEPTNVGPGSRVVISSPDIEADGDYEVLFGGQSTETAELIDGRVSLTLPRLEGLGAGEQTVLLEVRHERRSLLRTSLLYDVAPELFELSPSEVRVGDVIRIGGVGLVGIDQEEKTPVVKVGELRAEVLDISAQAVSVRVPMVTRRKAVEVPVVVRFDGNEPLEARNFLRVAPRIVSPVDFVFSPSFAPGLDAWQVSTPVGVAFYLKEESTSATQVPERVRVVCDNFNRLFRIAPDDPTLRVDAAAVESWYALRSVDSTGGEVQLVEFSEADLETTSLGGGTRVEPHILAFWQATVWNYMLDAFARAEPPVVDETSPSYHRSLAWLVDNNRKQGGFGRPESRDLEQLEEADREILSLVLLQPPRGFGDLSGVWQAQLANVFFPTDDVEVSLLLDLDHVAGDLRGSARIDFRDNYAFVKSQSTRAIGEVQVGSPPRLVLRLAFDEPVGLIVLDGTARSFDLQGTFKAGQRRPGEWYASRRVEEESASGR